MGKIVTQDKVVLMIQPNGKPGGVGTGLEPMSIDSHGFTGKTNNTVPGQGQIYGRDAFARFRVKVTFKETPGGLNTGTIEYEKEQKIDFLEKRAKDESRFGVWEIYAPCARLDNPYGWLNGGRLDYRGNMFVTSTSEGDAPVREASGQPVVTQVPVSWEYNLAFLPLAITSIIPTIAENTDTINDITSLIDPNPNNCIAGYRGPDQHMYTAGEAGSGVTAEVLGTRDAGSTWTATSTQPFAADEDISAIESRITTTQFRLVAARLTTDAAAAAEIGYADMDFGDEFTTTWTNVDVGSTNGDVIVALKWLFYNRMYAAVGAVGSEGEIWVSTDQSEAWTEVYSDTTVINGFAKGWGEGCKDVYAYGATNLVLREVDHSGTFETLVGPSGGGTFFSMAVANDGLIFAGNGTSLFVSNNGALNTGGWSELKDFTASHEVREIFLPEGDSNHLYLVVETGSGGEFHHSNDGGNSFNRLTVVTNPSYNAAVASSEDVNLFYVVGDANATPNGVVYKVSPSAVGC